jgi:hypothetical protein
MKSKVWLLASGIVGLVLSVSGGAQADAYGVLPLEKNNLWVYQTNNPAGEMGVHTLSVKEEAYLGGGWYANDLSGLLRSTTRIWDHVGSWDMWVYDNSNFSKIFRFGAHVGNEWAFRTNACDSYQVRYLANNHEITVPAGTFVNARQYDFTNTPAANVKCAGPALEAIEIIDGVGPVFLKTSEKKSSLMYAYVDSKEVAVGPHETRVLEGVESTMVFNANVFSHEGTAERLGVAFVVRNVSKATKTFSYNNGQAFEIDVFDEKGALVRRWSDNQFFTQALWNFSLAPKETRVFYGSIELSATASGSLLNGTHQVVGYLTNNEGSGKHSVNIQVTDTGSSEANCGKLSCNPKSDYCQVVYPGIQPAPELGLDFGPSFSCQAIPEKCTEDRSCTCLESNVFSNACSEDKTGLLTSSIYAP